MHARLSALAQFLAGEPRRLRRAAEGHQRESDAASATVFVAVSPERIQEYFTDAKALVRWMGEVEVKLIPNRRHAIIAQQPFDAKRLRPSITAEPNPSDVANTAISVAAHLEAELEEALEEHRVTRPSFLVLEALERAEGQTLGQRELVTRVGRTSGTVSVRLARLERVRMIERQPDPDNRRSVTVKLTERGHSLVQAARPAYAERAARLIAALPTGARPALAEQLGAWLRFFEPDEHDEGMSPRLGVAVATAAVATRMRRAVGLPDEPGVLVVRVGRESAADAAGVSRGDLITEAGASVVRSIGDLERAVRAADGSIALKVLRGAERREFDLTLDGEA